MNWGIMKDSGFVATDHKTMSLEISRHAENACVVTAEFQMQLLKSNLQIIKAESDSQKAKDSQKTKSTESTNGSPDKCFIGGVLNDFSAEELIPERYTRIPFSGPVPLSAFNQVADNCEIPLKFNVKMAEKRRQKVEKERPFTSLMNSPGHPLSPYKRSSSSSSPRAPLSPLRHTQDQAENVKSPTHQSKLFLITSFFGGVDNSKSPNTPARRNLKTCFSARDLRDPVSPLFHPEMPLTSPDSPLRQSSRKFDVKSPTRRRFRLPLFCRNEPSWEPEYNQINGM